VFWERIQTEVGEACNHTPLAPPQSSIKLEARTSLVSKPTLSRKNPMKLNPLQRWAYKLGIPRSVLNIFAQEYYGYAVPNAEGKYPHWWYEEQGVPTNFRDYEVPKEILKREKECGGLRTSGSPKVYVKVKHGNVAEIVADQSLESAPAISQYRREMPNPYTGYPETVLTQQTYATYHGPPQAVDDIAMDEYMARITERRYNTVPTMLHRSVSETPNGPGTNSDIMSFIHQDRMPPPRSTRPAGVDPASLHPTWTINAPQTTGQPHRRAAVPPVRASTLPNRPMDPEEYLRGPPLPKNPKPVKHQRTPTTLTDDDIFKNYRHRNLAGPPLPPATYRNSQKSVFESLGRVPEDDGTVWSGYNIIDEEDDEEGWEDTDDGGSRGSYRRLAQDGLRQYRRE
jgi:hypothetical protein